MAARTRNLWPLGIAGGLGLVVVVNLAMVMVARSSPPIVETEDAYEAGLHHEDVLAEARASAALGWSAEVSQAGEEVSIVLKDRDHTPVAGLRGQVALTRGDTRSQDAQVAVVERSTGTYTAPFAGRSGVYRLETRLTDGTRTWVDRRILVVAR